MNTYYNYWTVLFYCLLFFIKIILTVLYYSFFHNKYRLYLLDCVQRDLGWFAARELISPKGAREVCFNL